MAATLKCVVVGDGGVGKTCMLISYCTNKFPSGYTPTVFDNYAVNVMVRGTNHQVGLFDTAGQETYDRLRVLAYPGTDVFLLCFSVINKDSFENIKYLWVDELRENCGRNVKIVLVGTQTDMRNEENTKKGSSSSDHITYEQGRKLSKQIGAYSYVECSALTQKGLKSVFDEAITVALDPTKKPKQSSRLEKFPRCLYSKTR